MNPQFARLHPYPFETLRRLTADIAPSPRHRPISLGIGEPKHPTPALIEDAIRASLAGLSAYPATAGEPKLREACTAWAQRRYGVTLDAAKQVLPVNGSREALFALAQTVVDAIQVRRHGGVPEPVLSNLRGRGACSLVRRRSPSPTATQRRNFAADWPQIDSRHLVAHATALHLLAGQSDRRGDAACGVAERCSS